MAKRRIEFTGKSFVKKNGEYVPITSLTLEEHVKWEREASIKFMSVLGYEIVEDEKGTAQNRIKRQNNNVINY